VNIAYTGEEGSTQRGAQRCVQTARTTSVGRSYTMNIRVAHGCAGEQCSQTHRYLQTGVDASSFSSVNAGMLLTNRGGCIIILECQRGHAVYKQGWARVHHVNKTRKREPHWVHSAGVEGQGDWNRNHSVPDARVQTKVDNIT
jgi:hypothetical protein